MRVAFQGERGSFSEEAATGVFGAEFLPVPCREFRDVGAALANDEADYAVLPVENSIAGSVLPSYDVLAAATSPVIAEITRPIRHFVMAKAGTKLADVQRVLSHPVALAQCSSFFLMHPDIEAVAAYDTAGAAKDVSKSDVAGIAAIAAQTAASLYGLEIIAHDVQDRADNQTRFFVLGDKPLQWPSTQWKTALLVETKNEPGALLAVLTPFARAGVNLSKLESRPGETPWTYRFFLELEGAVSDANVAAALAGLFDAASVKVLGSLVVLVGH